MEMQWGNDSLEGIFTDFLKNRRDQTEWLHKNLLRWALQMIGGEGVFSMNILDRNLLLI